MAGDTPFLNTSLEFLGGVGPERAKLLRSELGIRTFGDLLHHFPFRYVDRTQFHTISAVISDEVDIQLRGRVLSVQLVGAKGKGQRLVAQFSDGTGTMELVWFKGIQWVHPKLVIRKEYVIFGRPSKFKSSYNMVHPELDTPEVLQNKMSATMVPVYPTSVKAAEKGMDSKGISRVMHLLVSQLNDHIPEILSDELRNVQVGLMEREMAFVNVHFPKDSDALRTAIFRLKFDELFFIQLKLLKLKLINQQKFRGAVFAEVGEMVNRFYNQCLPFELTGAQKRVIKEIRRDLGSGIQMNRLVQGDVGSGKTIVALMAMLLAIDNNFQAALMAPTEILAEQHFRSIAALVEPLGINIRLLTGSTKTAQRKIIHEELMSGALQILIGTHALIEDVVQFKQLGLVVVDEQHRFGVQQRAKLWLKGSDAQKVPHFLIMTATPIPRTLAMTVYGDLDTSVIDELPPGRKPIKTLHRLDSARIKVFEFMREEITKGRQVYVVYPLIDESEKMDYKDLTDGYESIVREFPLPQYQVSILHGRMKAEDKEFEMQRFKKGITHIMVSTTVIEVGVDVPNASVMVIESAERFGLSQLHQLRGRVGRGAEQSFCILMTGYALSQEAKTRMETMVRTNDGFEIAEVDMKLRGPGDIQGTQQSGTPVFRISNLTKDGAILQLARNTAIQLLQDDPELKNPQNATTRHHLLSEMKDKPNWARVS